MLDDRSKRRIRRNGLSEEMNEYESDKKANSGLRKEILVKDQELQKLKQELDKARQLTEELRSDDDTQLRVDEVEAELEALRESFRLENSEPATWDHIPRDGRGPGSDGGDTILIYEDDSDDLAQPQSGDQQDALIMGLELESARQAKQSLFRSSRSQSTSVADLHFEDSPSRPRISPSATTPSMPTSFYHDLSKQLKAATSRAEDAELALQALEGEVRALGFSQENENNANSDLTALANHFRQMRLELERLMPGETALGFENPALLPEIMNKLKQLVQQLKDREAELKTMRDQQRSLKGNFEHAIVAAEKATARVKELEDTIENSAEEMLGVRMRAQALEREVAEKDSSIKSLVAALNKYRDEVCRLEQLISQVEKDQLSALEDVKQATRSELEEKLSDMDAKVAAEERGRRAAEESAVCRLTKINELETALAAARQRAEVVEKQLSGLEQRVSFSSRDHEEEVGCLNSRMANLATALSSANAEVDKLRILNAKLEERYRNEVAQGARAVERMQNEVLRSVAKVSEDRKSYLRGAKVRLGNWDLESDDMNTDESGAPMTPASVVRFVDVDDNDRIAASVEISRGKKHHRRSYTPTPGLGIRKGARRRYDSGIGMDSLSEAETEAEEESEVDQGMLTPD